MSISTFVHRRAIAPEDRRELMEISVAAMP
jgi:hypothetical protein